MARILFVISEDWALATHRLHLVKAALKQGHTIAVATRISTYRDQLENLGVTVFDWRLQRRSLHPFRELLTIKSLRTFISSFNPDLIHAVALKPVIYTGLATRFGFAGGIVFALGGVGYIFSNSSLRALTLRVPIKLLVAIALMGRQRRLILQNEDDVEHFTKAGIIDRRTIRLVRGAGVETDLFKPSPIPFGAPVVLLPSRLLWDKGVYEFVKVAERLKNELPQSRFVIVGDTDQQNPANIPNTTIRLWTNAGVVEHWQRVSHEKMPEIYKKASIVCLPSYREGLPKVLLEAASSARPIVAFDVAGCRDVVRPGVNGTLVPFKSVDLLQAAIWDLMLDRQRCIEMGIRGRGLVEQKFSSEIINDYTFKIWKEVMRH